MLFRLVDAYLHPRLLSQGLLQHLLLLDDGGHLIHRRHDHTRLLRLPPHRQVLHLVVVLVPLPLGAPVRLAVVMLAPRRRRRRQAAVPHVVRQAGAPARAPPVSVVRGARGPSGGGRVGRRRRGHRRQRLPLVPAPVQGVLQERARFQEGGIVVNRRLLVLRQVSPVRRVRPA